MEAGAYLRRRVRPPSLLDGDGLHVTTLEFPNAVQNEAPPPHHRNRHWHATLPARPHGSEMGCRVLQLGADPLLDVASSVSEVPAHPETSWPETSMPPAVDRLQRHVEVASEVPGAEQFIESFHLHIVARVDVNWVTSSCQGCCQRVFGGSSPILPAARHRSDSYL